MTQPTQPPSEDEWERSMRSALDEFLPEEPVHPAAPVARAAAVEPSAPSGLQLIAHNDHPLGPSPGRAKSDTILTDLDDAVARAAAGAEGDSAVHDASFEAVIAAFESAPVVRTVAALPLGSPAPGGSPEPAARAVTAVPRPVPALAPGPNARSRRAKPALPAFLDEFGPASPPPSPVESRAPDPHEARSQPHETPAAAPGPAYPRWTPLSPTPPLVVAAAAGTGTAGAAAVRGDQGFSSTSQLVARGWGRFRGGVQGVGSRLYRRDVAIVALSVVGLTELGWIGWRLGRLATPSAATADARPVTGQSGAGGAAAAVLPPVVAAPPGGAVAGGLTPPLSLGVPAAGSPPAELAAVTKPATLAVRTEREGALVLVDGTLRGRSPVTIANLSPGAHTVVVSRLPDFGQQQVQLQAGSSTSILVPFDRAAPPRAAATAKPAVAAPPPAARPSGWVTVTSAVPVDLFEAGRNLGSSRAGRLGLTAGRHELEAVNEALGVRSRATVDIVAGRTAAIKVNVPPGTININALPWAAVRIDGAEVGDTPLANLQLSAGEHEVLFTHPELGERRVRVTVRSGAPARVSTDLRKKD